MDEWNPRWVASQLSRASAQVTNTRTDLGRIEYAKPPDPAAVRLRLALALRHAEAAVEAIKAELARPA